MRIYHKIEELIFDDPEKQAVIGKAANEQIQLLAELYKYKMMWALRSMEQEIEQCGGIIYLISDAGKTSKIELEGFTGEQTERIKSLFMIGGVFK